MKNKYQRMSKEEKKALIAKFNNTKVGKEALSRLTRLIIIGIMCLVGGIFLLLDGILRTNMASDYVSGTVLIISSFIFIIGGIRIRGKRLNSYALKQK